MQELSGGIYRLPLRSTNNSMEHAFVTEDMWTDGMAIRYFTFTAEFEAKTYISLRQYDEEQVADYEIYWGDQLAPIMAYRVIKDLFELYDKLMLEDFLEVVTTYLSKECFSSRSTDCSVEAKRKQSEDIQCFFISVREAIDRWGLNFNS